MEDNLMEGSLIPLADLASTFHRSKTTLYRWADAGIIPTRKIGTTIYMTRDDVTMFTRNRERIDRELDERRMEYGRILDAETMSLIVNSLEDALHALRTLRTAQSGSDD